MTCFRGEGGLEALVLLLRCRHLGAHMLSCHILRWRVLHPARFRGLDEFHPNRGVGVVCFMQATNLVLSVGQPDSIVAKGARSHVAGHGLSPGPSSFKNVPECACRPKVPTGRVEGKGWQRDRGPLRRSLFRTCLLAIKDETRTMRVNVLHSSKSIHRPQSVVWPNIWILLSQSG